MAKKYAAIRKRLVAERATLRGDVEYLEDATRQQHDDAGMGNHIADEATDIMIRERDMALQDNTEDLLAKIDDAIERIDDGTYGTCQRCGKEINPERLEALPYARYCIECQSIVEQEQSEA